MGRLGAVTQLLCEELWTEGDNLYDTTEIRSPEDDARITQAKMS